MVLFVVLDHFLNDELQKALGEIRIKISLTCQVFEAFDLPRFAVRVGRRKVVCGLETAHGLGVLKAFAQRVDKDRVEPVNALAVLLEDFRGADYVVSQWPIPLV